MHSLEPVGFLAGRGIRKVVGIATDVHVRAVRGDGVALRRRGIRCGRASVRIGSRVDRGRSVLGSLRSNAAVFICVRGLVGLAARVRAGVLDRGASALAELAQVCLGHVEIEGDLASEFADPHEGAGKEQALGTVHDRPLRLAHAQNQPSKARITLAGYFEVFGKRVSSLLILRSKNQPCCQGLILWIIGL